MGIQRLMLVQFALGLSTAFGPASDLLAMQGRRGPNPNRQAQLENWFYAPRVQPDGSIPPGSRQRAIAALSAVPLSPLQKSGPTIQPLGGGIALQPFAGPWKYPVGPPLKEASPPIYGFGNMSLRVNAVAVHPTDPNTVYLGTSFGGVAKSTDGGTTWNYLTDALPSQAITSIAIDTTSPNIVYAVAGDLYFNGHGDSLFGAGVYRSTDSGATWGVFGQSTLNGLAMQKIAVDPGTSGSQTSTTLYLAAAAGPNAGFFKSVDSGQTWTLIGGNDVGWDIGIDNTTNGTVYFAAASGLWKTTNAGGSVTQIHTNLAAPGDTYLKCKVAVLGSTIYFSDSNGPFGNGTFLPNLGYGLSGYGQLFKSADGGGTWSELTAAQGFCNSQCFYDQALLVDPANPNRIFLGGIDPSSSSDSGNSFTDYSNYAQTVMTMHPDFHAFAFAPSNTNVIYAGNDGGVYKSIDGGHTWSNKNTNLPGGLTLGAGSSLDGHMLSGYQDDGGFYYSGSGNWIMVQGGDSGFDKIDPSNSSRLYVTAGADQVASGIILRSIDAGNTGADITPAAAITNSETTMFFPPLYMDPTNTSVLLTGFQSVYRSVDAGNNWTRVAGQNSPDAAGKISAIGVAPSNPDVVYVGTTANRVFVTGNATAGNAASWTLVTSGLPSTQLPTAIAVDPTNSSIAYLTLSQYGTSGSPEKHVYKTTNGGTSWLTASNGLPDAPFNDILIDTTSPSSLFAASDVGVFNSTNSGVTWTQLTAGMPTGLIVNSLSLNAGTRRLVAATYGRGVYSLILPQAPPPPSGISASFIGSSSVTWTWTPDAAGYGVTTYGVYNGTAPTVLLSSGPATTFTLQGLQPNTAYSIIVTAANGNFESANSAASTAVTGALAVVAGPILSVSSASITPSWNANGNPAGTTYLVQASTDAAYGIVNSSSSVGLTSATVSSLTPNTTYFLRVQAISSGGPPSAFVSLPSTSTLAAVPGIPSAAAQTTATITASWGANGNPAGTAYTAKLFDSSLSTQLNSAQTNSPAAAFSALTANTSYFVQVQATNSSGIATSTSQALVSTYSNPPGVSSVAFPAVNLSSAVVQWIGLPSSPNSATAEGYRAEASTASDFSGTIFFSSGSGAGLTSLVVSGLAGSTTYFFRVGSLNWLGQANFTAIGSTQTPRGTTVSQTVTNTAPLALTVATPSPAISLITVDVPIQTFPAGTVISLNSNGSAGPPAYADGNEAALTFLAGTFDVSAGGLQPNGNVTFALTYDPAQLAANVDAGTIIVARNVAQGAGSGQWTILPTTVNKAAHTITATTNHFSLFAPFIVTPAAALSSVQVFPIPWQIGSGSSYDAPVLTFSNLPTLASVKIYSILGESLWDATANSGGILTWDGTTRHGAKAASGTYIAVIESSGSKITHRVVITR